jgi:hypothetical protein
VGALWSPRGDPVLGQSGPNPGTQFGSERGRSNRLSVRKGEGYGEGWLKGEKSKPLTFVLSP